MSSHHTTTVDSESVGGRLHTERTHSEDESTTPYDVAHLEAEVAALRTALAAQEARQAEIIERYERLLAEAEADRRAEASTDPDRHHPGRGRSVLAWLRELF